MKTFIAFFINRKLARRGNGDGSYYCVISASTKAIALERAIYAAGEDVYRGMDGVLRSRRQVIVEELTYARAKKIFGMYKTFVNALETSDWTACMFQEAADMLTDDDAIKLSDGEFSR